jgi:hypothetical protein
MNKKLQLLFMSCNAIGYLVLAATRFFQSAHPGFLLGFFEGFSIACILIGFPYLIWCIVKRKNPYCVQ